MSLILFIDEKKDGSVSISQDSRKSCIERAKDSKKCYILEAVNDTRRGMIGTAMTPWNWYRFEKSNIEIRLQMSYHYQNTPAFKTLDLIFDADDSKHRGQISSFISSLLSVNELNHRLGTDREVDISTIEMRGKKSNMRIDATGSSLKQVLKAVGLNDENERVHSLLMKNDSPIFDVQLSENVVIYLPETNIFYFLTSEFYHFLYAMKEFEIFLFRDPYVGEEENSTLSIKCETVKEILSLCYTLPMCFYLDYAFFENSISALVEFQIENTHYSIPVSSIMREGKINLIDILMDAMNDHQKEML